MPKKRHFEFAIKQHFEIDFYTIFSSFLYILFCNSTVGDPGTGKTHLAQAIGNLCCEKMITVRYFKFSELIGKLSKESSRAGMEKVLVSLSSIPCLIIDEIGFSSSLDTRTSDLFFQLIDRRYDKGKRTTIFISNRKPAEWNDMFSDEMTARCPLDRIMDMYCN